MPESNDKKPKKSLDLISSEGKKSARRAKSESAAATTPDAAVAESASAATKSKAPAKKAVLDLLGGSKKRSSKTVAKTDDSSAAVTAESQPVEQAAADEAVAAPAAQEAAPQKPQQLSIKTALPLAELATLMGLKNYQLTKELINWDIFANSGTIIEVDIAIKLCEKFGIDVEREKREKGAGVHKPAAVVEAPVKVEPAKEPKDKLQVRTPIVTVMGHVDHGKTSLLDQIRKARVAAGEAGGITQHIGAYTVKHQDSNITFLDTPGHAIFTEMRARGADVTDIVVLVVAADDGIMPQTKEAIAHAKSAGKTIIVAINKCDLVGADPMRVKSELMQEDLLAVEYGGDIECVEVSALTGQGISDLLDLIALQAEVLELKANPKANCHAAVIESRVESGKGISSTLIVTQGTLKVGTTFICGAYAGKVRGLCNDAGQKVKSVGPGMPAEVTGFVELPNVGDELVEMANERAAKKLSDERIEAERKERLAQPKKSRMEDLLSMMQNSDTQKPILKLILKGDVQGSVEAIRSAISDITSTKVEVSFIHSGVGAITESDILLASSSNGVVLGFNTKVEPNAVKAAKREGVQVKLYSIVYELIDQVRDAMLGMLAPESRETIIGHAEVKQVFKLIKGKAAGCIIKDGKVTRSAGARVLRDGQPVFDGKMSTLRRVHDDVDEVRAGVECGIRLGDFNDYEAGDIIECYLLEKIKQSL